MSTSGIRSEAGSEQGEELPSSEEPSVAGSRSSAPSELEADSHSRQCTSLSCSDDRKAFQPTESAILSQFVWKECKFLPVWYKSFKWIALCTTKKKVFCVYCLFAEKHKLLLSKKSDEAFIVNGFSNYKKAIEKFQLHEKSDCHLEAKMKFASISKPTVQEQLSTQVAQVQTTQCSGLLKQLEAMSAARTY